jgi:cell wall-associated NlpC family hydrolase
MGKKMIISMSLLIAAIILVACTDAKKPSEAPAMEEPVGHENTDSIDPQLPKTLIPGQKIETGTTTPDALIAFAKTLIGTSYCPASTDINKGFDCSGFVTYVFNHFNIAVPRSSVDFTNVGKEIDKQQARPGDLILFTGTDSTIRVVGHMGIVIDNSSDTLHFIHSSSGKAYGVVVSPLERYYSGRFVKVIRIFPKAYFNPKPKTQHLKPFT